MLAVDDDDTVPTGNVEVWRAVHRAVAALPVGVVEWGAATAPGPRRRVNEDAWGQRDGTFVVADGMGGRGGGALAARTVVDGLLRRSTAPAPNWQHVVSALNADVTRAGAEHGFDRLGTTLLAAVVGGPLVTLVHVGDSRAYRWSAPADGEPRLDLLTADHNVRSELLAAGLEVGEYRDRGVALHGLTSFIGLDGDVLRVDVLTVPVRLDDRLLLCTDGVHRTIDVARLRAAMAQPTARRAAEDVVGAARQVGGRDDATAVVVHLGTGAP